MIYTFMYITMFGVRTSFPTTFWSAKSTFVPEAKEEIQGGSFEDDVETPYHQEKMAIIDQGDNQRTQRGGQYLGMTL